MAGSRNTKHRKAAKPLDPRASSRPASTRPTATRTRRRSTAREALAAAPRLLAGGNPQIPKGDGEAPVQAYIAAMPGWKRQLGTRLDALIQQHVPLARKAVKWNSPFYGIDGQGWLVAFHTFTDYVKISFFAGASLRPVPPGGSTKDARWIDVHEHDLDEPQLIAWLQQAAALPGWLTADIQAR